MSPRNRARHTYIGILISASPTAYLHRHRRRLVDCASIDLAVLHMSASAESFSMVRSTCPMHVCAHACVHAYTHVYRHDVA